MMLIFILCFQPEDGIRDQLVTGVQTSALPILAVTFLLLSGAFYCAQVMGYKDYRLQSEKNRLRQVPLLAPRGAIYDRNGESIAENEPGYTIKLFAPSTDSLRAVLSRLSAIVPLDSAAVRGILTRFRAA